MNWMRNWLVTFTLLLSAVCALAASGTPDGLVRQLSDEVMTAIKQDKALKAGDLQKIGVLVDTTIMPHVDFERMTSSAVGHYWNQASQEQKQRLQEQFKHLLMRTYSGAVTKVKDQRIVLKPLRASPGDTEVLVQTLIQGTGDPLQLDYRLEKVGDEWKIYDVNVLGAWLVQNYKSQFSQEIAANGIDGLITKLEQRNKANAAAAAAKATSKASSGNKS